MFLKPDISVNRITDLTPEHLNAFNIKALLIDVDNTLSTHKGEKFVDNINEWIDLMRNNGIKLMILSNAKNGRLKAFAMRIGIEGCGMAAKPLPFGYINAAKKMGMPPKNTAIVGDQLFTDILGGKISGVKTVLVKPILLENSTSFRIRRYFERKLLKKYNLLED